MRRISFILFSIFLTVPVHAASGPWQINKHGKVRLIAADSVAPKTGTLWLGVEFKPIPGWHVYWKNAGDAGYPPKVDWKGSTGFSNPQWLWPAPHRYTLPGDIVALGYEDDAVYPVRAELTGSAPVHAVAHLSYLTCGEICVPYKYDLALELPRGPEKKDPEIAPLIERSAASVPESLAQHPELKLDARYVGNPAKAAVIVSVAGATAASRDSNLFFEKSETLAFGTPNVVAQNDGVQMTVLVSTISGQPLPPTIDVAYTLTHLAAGAKSFSIENKQTLRLEPGTIPSANETVPLRPRALWGFLVLGFFGGLILNIMPCVLPVLSIKLLGLLQSSANARGVIIRNALASASGIIASFLSLAAIAIALRHAGMAVGWGIQFQQPVFVGLMAVVVFVFALNLWGVFEFNIPRFLGGAASAVAQRESASAYFLSGVFATLLATPCSAPFLGTAMGFALAQPAVSVLSIFFCAGVGMAAPYFMLAIFPGSLRWLPKPGLWMIRLKHFFGWLLAATGIWLLTILFTQLRHAPAATPAASAQAGAQWVPFDEDQIQRLLGQGKSVFVDVTADWCFTCKYNERVALRSSDVLKAFRDQGIVLMRADWTTRNAVIGDYLKKFGRAGIPFYALYRPGRDPVVLSEFLTPGKVLKALQSQ